ncbi:MAG: hypothetical protein AABW47_00580 [Nanoarchaeota archaeon]
MAEKIVSRTKKVFTGSYSILVVLLLLGLIPGLIYYLAKQGEEKYKGQAEKEKIDDKSEGLGISGFTLGVLGIVFSGWVGLILSVIGFVFCFVQQKKYKTKLGKIGIILSIVGFVLSIVIIVLYASVLAPLLNKTSLA